MLGGTFKAIISAADGLLTSLHVESTPYYRLLASISVLVGEDDWGGGAVGLGAFSWEGVGGL